MIFCKKFLNKKRTVPINTHPVEIERIVGCAWYNNHGCNEQRENAMSDDVDLGDVLIVDDASEYKDTLDITARQALFHPNGLVEGKTGLSPEERGEIEALLGPDRPGFAKALKSVL